MKAVAISWMYQSSGMGAALSAVYSVKGVLPMYSQVATCKIGHCLVQY